MVKPIDVRRLDSADSHFDQQLQALIRYEPEQDARVGQVVADIIAQVRERGDQALLDYTERFDRFRPESAQSLVIQADELRQAFDDLPTDTAQALQAAGARVRDYHQRQSTSSWSYTDADGTRLGQKITPLDRVGLYVPGGKAAYPSSVLMNALPAKVAGVGEIIMVVPTPDGIKNQAVLAAAWLAGVDKLITVGGAQAVAALAFGTATVPAVDKIVGPGNAYVAEAKRQVFGTVGIDMIAGPSEILVLADGSAPADWAAMDLFSQAEHDQMAQAILLCPDGAYIDAVCEAMARLLPTMPREAVIRQSLADRGALIQVRDLDEACEIANTIVPEHLEIAAVDASQWLDKIRHAGAIFVGAYASESLGDYCAGPNHVLPTMRTARFSSPLGVYDFQKRSSVIEVSPAGAQRLGPIAAALADAEGLQAHAQSALLRVQPISENHDDGELPAQQATHNALAHALADSVREMTAYPVADSTGFTKLDAMENPYTLPAELREAFAQRLAALDLNRYPVPSYRALKARIAHAFAVPDGYPVVLGNGSDELILMLSLLTAQRGHPVLAPVPSFVMYGVDADLAGSDFVGVDLTAQFQLDLPAMLDAIEREQPGLLYLAYPNNPTGAAFDASAIEQIIRTAPGLVVIDEAYQPFAKQTWMSRLPEFGNLIVMRTVSKIGLAGIRLGYLTAAPAITEQLEKVRPPYNISVLSEAAALFALEHKAVFDAQAGLLREQRDLMLRQLGDLDGVEVFDSETNFILARFADANRVHQGLLARQILVRNVSKMHDLLANCLRITVSTPAENQAVLNALKAVLA